MPNTASISELATTIDSALKAGGFQDNEELQLQAIVGLHMGDASLIAVLMAARCDREFLLSEDVDGRTCVHSAVRRNDGEFIAELQKNGLTPTELLRADDARCTPLHHAAKWGMLSMTEVLLAALPDQAARARELVAQDVFGDTPWQHAERRGHAGVLEVLSTAMRANGVEVGASTRRQHRSAAHGADAGHAAGAAAPSRTEPAASGAHRPDGPASDSLGANRVHHAALRGDTAVLRALVLEGRPRRDLLRPAHDDVTPAHLAAFAGHANFLWTLAEFLQDDRVPMWELMSPAQGGWTPAHFAAHGGRHHVIEVLAEALTQADVSAAYWLTRPDGYGRTPADIAVQGGQPRVIEALDDAGVPGLRRAMAAATQRQAWRERIPAMVAPAVSWTGGSGTPAFGPPAVVILQSPSGRPPHSGSATHGQPVPTAPDPTSPQRRPGTLTPKPRSPPVNVCP